MLEDAEGQLQALLEVRQRPHLVDDSVFAGIIRASTGESDDLWLFEHQLRRWATGALTPAQRGEVVRLGAQLTRLRALLGEISAVAGEIKSGRSYANIAKGSEQVDPTAAT